MGTGVNGETKNRVLTKLGFDNWLCCDYVGGPEQDSIFLCDSETVALTASVEVED